MNREEKRIIKIFAIIFILVSIIVFVLFINKDNIVRKKKFVAPVMDENAVVGSPLDVDADLSYQEMSIKDDYVVYLCATPVINDNKLIIYFTSSDRNKDLLKIRIFDKDNYLLGESYLIEPNSYIKEIELNRKLEDNELISIKVMSYEKGTYYSNGSFKLNVFVKNI